MSDFREKQTVGNGRNSSDVSDEEEQTFDRVLNARLKVVPKRKGPSSNGGASTSTGNGNGQRTDEAEMSDGSEFPAIASKSAGHLWTDTVLMQSLEEKMGVSAGPGTTIVELRDRGTETYAPISSGEKRKRNEDIADEMMEEEGTTEGGKTDGTKDAKMEGDNADETLSVAVDTSISLWEGVDTGAAELPTEQQNHGRRTGKWKKFKRDNRRHQKQSHPWKKPFKKGQKIFKNEAKAVDGKSEQTQKRQWKMIPPEKFVPRKLMTPNYAKTKLLDVEINADEMSEEQLANELAEALGEKVPELMQKVVHFAGKSHAVELFKQCQEVERNGGMLTQNRLRRRTPGGVFMKLFNESKEISEENKKTMHEFGTEKQRQSGELPKWWEKMKQRKEKKAEKAKEKGEATQNTINEIKELPTSSELIKPELNDTELTNGNEETNRSGEKM
ncbi:hypothetical protein niasHT_011403 [Heterodera trifolii]|uniref:Phosphorylated adapter RNA export protein n=1 Tax=Heterodera trifolii TaxID=157864 RepID=A0ABD2LIA7_9BILA